MANDLGMTLRGAGVRRGGGEILRGIDWELRPGESWAVFGGNGAGKSTLLSLARGDLWPSSGSRTYFVEGEEQVSPIGFRERTALVSAAQQLWYARFEAGPEAWEVALSGLRDTPLVYGEPGVGERSAAHAALGEVGLADCARRVFADLSQGQQRRVLLARALIGRPAILFLDEWLEGLDARTRDEMIEALRVQSERGVRLVCATHRPAEAKALGLARGLVLEGGRVACQGDLESALARAFDHEAIPSATKHSSASARGVRRTRAVPGILLEFTNVTAARGGRAVLAGFSWTVRSGEHWAVTGRNGSGKSTLLALAAGDLHPAAGRIARFGGRRPLSLWAIRQRAALVSFSLDVAHEGGMTGSEIVISGLRGHIGLHEPPTSRETELARAILAELNLGDLRDRPAETLSTGQLRRLLLARALVGGPDLLLLDEPFAGLDAPSREEMRRLLVQASGHGATLVMTSHHIEDLPELPFRELKLGG